LRSRLDGFKARRTERPAPPGETPRSGSRLWDIVVFWGVALLLTAILSIPENPLWKYNLGERARDGFRARVNFTFTVNGEEQVFSRGDVLVSRGALVDKDVYALLSAENEAWKKENATWLGFATRVGAAALAVLAVLALFIVTAFRVFRRKKPPPEKLLYLGVFFCAAFLAAKLISLFLPVYLWLFIPLAFTAVVAAVAVDTVLASCAALLSAPLLVLALAPHSGLAFSLMSGAVVAPFATEHARSRGHLLRAGLLIGGIQLVVVFSFGLFGDAPMADLLIRSLSALVSGLLTGALTIILLPIIEWLFGVVTDISLLELSDMNHPLLKRMLIEAPGTYQHSLLVAAMAESAAEAIGANALLAKVGALFHDIGKLVRARYFVENNPDATELHKKLKYSLSAMLIISHVKDGLELGREYNLPKPVLDIIVQHQGTTLVEYFYRKALESGDSLALPNEQFFQYPGPKPQTREAAIVMIADTVEAATRTLRHPSPKRIRELVHNLIMKKLTEGQFDECDITMAELKQIEDRICWIVQSMTHQRIEYPDAASGPVHREGYREIVKEG